MTSIVERCWQETPCINHGFCFLLLGGGGGGPHGGPSIFTRCYYIVLYGGVGGPVTVASFGGRRQRPTRHRRRGLAHIDSFAYCRCQHSRASATAVMCDYIYVAAVKNPLIRGPATGMQSHSKNNPKSYHKSLILGRFAAKLGPRRPWNRPLQPRRPILTSFRGTPKSSVFFPHPHIYI